MEPVAIVGIGSTSIEARKVEHTFADMVWEAVNAALDDAQMTIDDIDNVVTTSNDFWDGRTISCMAVGDASGASAKPVSCVEGDGTFGAFYGLTRTLSGCYGTTLVTAHSKGSQSDSSLITNAAFDPIYCRELGLDMVTACALQAQAYMHRTGTTARQLARVSVKNHGNGCRNPQAQLPLELSVEDVLQSEMIADPLHKLDCSPISDGACALILARPERLPPGQADPVWIRGAAFCSDAFFLGDRDLSQAPALRQAAQRAYTMAGITKPREEIGVAEVYDAFTYQELMWLEGLDLCDDGQAGAEMENGTFDLDGPLPVNPSGGLLSGHPVIAAGLIRLAETTRQLRGDGENRQVPTRPRYGLAHGVNGLCGQSHCVWVLEGRE